MSHATHFLERLARVDRPEQLDLALALYRDAPLVKHVLSRVRLPEGAERVALSLGEGAGPYVVVARDGGFVTCLGEGMTTDGLPVVARGHLDALARESDELRRRLDLAEEIAPGERGYSRLMRRFVTAGPCAAREDFLALTAVAPLCVRRFLKEILRVAEVLFDGSADYYRMASKPSAQRTVKELRALRSCWELIWSTADLAVLAACTAPRAELELLEVEDGLLASHTLLALNVPGVAGVALRGACAVARIGKPMLGPAKRFYRGCVGLAPVLGSFLALQALAVRHRSMRAEVLKALLPDRGDGPLPAGDVAAASAQFKSHLTPLFSRILEDPDAARATAMRFGRAKMRALAEKGLSPRFRFAREEDVPDDLALAMLSLDVRPFGDAGRVGPIVLSIGATLALARPEELFLPAALAEELRDDDLEPMCALARTWVGSAPPTVRAAPAPAPNERCPCGSGRKYKRCCQAKRAAGT